MRQDAVMEQVFELVNIVLQRDRETKRRNLSVRSYRVIPLAAQAGILEFVENTQPLQLWLLEAHRKCAISVLRISCTLCLRFIARYRPKDIQPQDAAIMLKKKREEARGREEPLVTMLTEIRKRFKPVMRHYFTERHKTPVSWFGMRLNYARSVATTSIVGHILGLGDRHTSNILLDNSSGEVVHIDLGIAFDQVRPQPGIIELMLLKQTLCSVFSQC
jgi:serine-protein kinase ATM